MTRAAAAPSASVSAPVGPPAPAPRPRVLLVVGSGRSGSTLVERALAGVPGVAGLGEVVHLWERGVRDDELCACGAPFGGCPFWQGVGRRAFGGWQHLDVDEVVHRRHEVVRTRRIAPLLTTGPSAHRRSERELHAAEVTAVLAAAQAESGARLVVDSSKMPAYAALLMRADVELCCLQVVRDPRGVACSMRKAVQRPEVVDGADLMHRTRPAETALWWSVFDLLSVGLRRVGGVPFVTVRYEDFVADPAATLGDVRDVAGLGRTPGDLAHVNRDRIALRPTHQVAGNPLRFASGETRVRPDDAWRTQLPARDRRAVELLTTGLRHRHGYR